MLLMSISFALNGLVGAALATRASMGGWGQGLPPEWAVLANLSAWSGKLSASTGGNVNLLVAMSSVSKWDRLGSYGDRESVPVQESLSGSIVQRPLERWRRAAQRQRQRRSSW